MIKKYLRNILAIALCGVAAASAAPAVFAAEPAPFNPFTMHPVIPGQVPDWKPVPDSKPVAPPPSMDKDKAYLHAKSYSECVESVMPTKNLSPVDAEASSLPYTSQTLAAINACLASKGATPDPMTAEDVATDAKSAAEEASYDPSSSASERAKRSQITRELIKKEGLGKFLPAEGGRGAAPQPVAAVVKAPPVVPLAMPNAEAKKTDAKPDDKPQATQTPYIPPAADKPVRGQGVFVPSEDHGPSPVFLP